MAVPTQLVDELLKSLNLVNVKGKDLLTRLEEELDELEKKKKDTNFYFLTQN